MATTTAKSKSDQSPVTLEAGETFEQKMARYGSPEFTAAAIRHFHAAKRKALEAQERAVHPSSELPEKSS